MPNNSHISNFVLHKFYLTNYIQTLGSGTNKPILVRAVNDAGFKDDVVVKLMDSERMNPTAAMKELVGSLLAAELNLNTPIPYLSEITKEFINSQLGQPEYTRLQNSEGINFSTKNIRGLVEFGPFEDLAASLRNEALKIFYFDLLIQNPDRTILHGKPNLFTTGSDLWVLDHEIAFSFLGPLIGRPPTEPWD